MLLVRRQDYADLKITVGSPNRGHVVRCLTHNFAEADKIHGAFNEIKGNERLEFALYDELEKLWKQPSLIYSVGGVQMRFRNVALVGLDIQVGLVYDEQGVAI